MIGSPGSPSTPTCGAARVNRVAIVCAARNAAVRWRPARVVHLVGRLAVQGLVRAVLVVPVDDELKFVLELGLVLRNCRETQQLFQRSVKPFHDGDAAMLADSPKARQDVPRLTPDVLEMLALDIRNRVLSRKQSNQPRARTSPE